MRRSGDSIGRQVLQWTHKAAEEEDDHRNSWKMDLEKDTWTAGFRYSRRNMEAAAHTELDEDKCGRWSTGSDESGSRSTVEGRVEDDEQTAKAYQGSILLV